MTHLDRPLLIHVAAESERRGRVVLAAQSATPHAAALAAAFSVAVAFETWIDCQLVQSPDVVALTAHAFARGVSRDGRIAPLRAADVSGWQAAATAAARKAVTDAARGWAIRLQTEVTQDSLTDALAKACAIEGPWNIVVLADAVQATETTLAMLQSGVGGATGIVCVGPRAVAEQEADGPVVVVVEDMDRLSQMLRAAERLAKGGPWSPRAVKLVVATTGQEQRDALDGHLRLLLADIPGDPVSPVTIADGGVTHGTEDEVAEAVRRLDGSFIIARTGGVAMPGRAKTSALVAVAACPLLLVR